MLTVTKLKLSLFHPFVTRIKLQLKPQFHLVHILVITISCIAAGCLINLQLFVV